MKQSDIEVMKATIKANITRINQLLDKEEIENRTQIGSFGYSVINRNNVEIRQRMKLLRKEMILFEKSMKG